MNTEQIMSLHNKAALTYNKDGLLYAARSEQLQAAIEALVQERDELKGEIDLWTSPARSVIQEMNSLVQERDKLAAENKALRDEHQQTIYANQCLVAALDRIHDVLNGVYVDDVAGIVNRALAANTPPV